MLRLALISVTLSSILLASSSKEDSQEFQILAKNIDTKSNIITAKSEVVAFSKDYYLVADKIIYDKDKSEIELLGNVLIVKNNTLQTQGNYAKLNLKTNDIYQNPIVLFDKSTNIWLNANVANKKDNMINLDATTISSCNCLEPFWSIKSSSSDYDTQDKWLNTYNTRLYIKNIPVLYTPYLGFSTDTTRRTGLLPPSLGYSNTQGLFYAQPIYFAPKDNYDIELIPQIRSNRGIGIYAYLRLLDSSYSSLDFKTGIFKEKKSYFKENNLKNEKHFGWNLNYKRVNLFSDDDTQDGLYLDINSLNDVEYQTLEKEEENISTDRKVESKFNYFYNTNDYYSAIYAKYYIDTNLVSNDSTLQELPQLQFHKYKNNIYFNKLTYNYDLQVKNYVRNEGINASIYELAVPFTYTENFLDEYLYLSLQNKIKISKYNYRNISFDLENGSLIQNELSLGLGTDLLKPYKNYLHTVNLSANYNYPKEFLKDGDLYNITTTEGTFKHSQLASFPATQKDKNINLNLTQSLFNKKELSEIIKHTINQTIIYNNFDRAKFDDLSNYVKYSFFNGSISNEFTYNFQDSKFVENSFNLNYNLDKLTGNFTYYNSKNSNNSNREDLESYTFKLDYQLNNKYNLGYYTNYNLKDELRNKQGFKFNIQENCWDFNVLFEKELIPTTTESVSTSAIEQSIVYLELFLKPLGGVKQKYEFEGK